MIITVGGFFFIKRKKSRDNELGKALELKNKIHLSGTATDIDNLYEILRTINHLRLSTIGQMYKVSPEVVMNWGKTLEGGNLAEIVYPRFGEPGLVYRNKSENPPER